MSTVGRVGRGGAQNVSRVYPSRRIHRGRSGPTDGNIPHFISRSERRRRQELRAAAAEARADRANAKEGLGESSLDDGTSAEHSPKREAGFKSLDVRNGQTEPRLDEAKLGIVAEHGVHYRTSENLEGDATASKQEATPDLEKQIFEEVKHLRRRMKNVQSSMRQRDGSDVQSWEVNSLNATYNCVQEWYSIVTYRSEMEQGGDILLSSAQVKEVPLEVFELIQLALQSGPLTGSNAGYFKRCGSDVATLASEFLDRVLYLLILPEQFDKAENQEEAAETREASAFTEFCSDSRVDTDSDGDDSDSKRHGAVREHQQGTEIKSGEHTSSFPLPRNIVYTLGLSQRQVQRLLTWKQTALAASESGKPPSKSFLKKQNDKAKQQKHSSSKAKGSGKKR